MKTYSHIEELESFINSLFTCSSSLKQPNNIEMVEKIYQLVTSRKFRKTAIDSVTEEDLKSKIRFALAKNAPICFSIPFGAYKNWRIPSSNLPDWSEIFCLSYLTKYVFPIASIYEPGISFNFSYSSGLMGMVSNMPDEVQTNYVKQFLKILSIVNSFIPKNIKFKLIDISKSYYSNELEIEFRNNFEYNLKNWELKYSKEVREKKIQSAKNNFQINGKENYSDLSPEQLEVKIKESAMFCDAVDCLDKRRKFNKGGKNIQLVFVRGPFKSLHIGSSNISSKHFWVSMGVLEKRGDRLLTNMISHKQIKDERYYNKIKYFKVDSPFKGLVSNYDSIGIYFDKL